jgi:lysophospholipase L1-like esterase
MIWAFALPGGAIVQATRALVVVFLAAVGSSVAGAAPGAAPVPAAYYLALGDSIAYGIEPQKVDANEPPSAFRRGYVDDFYARLRSNHPSLKLVNYGCPGESTTTFLNGGCPWLGRHKLHDAFTGTQLQAALAFLHDNRGRVSPITLNLWGNDAAAVADACGQSPGCVANRFPGEVAAFEGRLARILEALHAAAPRAVIIVTGDFNTDVGDLAETDPLWQALDNAIRTTAAAHHARFADTFPLFNGSGTREAEKAAICKLTYVCSADDGHPTPAGYAAIADAVYRASGFGH